MAAPTPKINAPDPDIASMHEDAIDVETHEFIIPVKEIKEPSQIKQWEISQAYRDLIGFILTMNFAIKSKKITDKYPVSEVIEKLIGMLEVMDKWIGEIPPIEQAARFGNHAFRDWFKRLQENSEEILRNALDDRFHRAVPEIAVYLVESVGNCTRIDYGTGHEMSFAAFLCCLYKVGALRQDDAQAVVFRVFDRYLRLMRKLQMTYRMEPAGTHGVWSLDDYQFIPFLWGSSQLIDHPRILPRSFTKPDIYEFFAKDYMFLSSIKYINEVKTGPFAEHSNQLWNISGVPLWTKVNTGLIKMYKVEVLSKYPVIQHFLFGSLMSIKTHDDVQP